MKNNGIERALEYGKHLTKELSPKIYYLAGYNQAVEDYSNEPDTIQDVLATEIMVLKERNEEMLEILQTMVSDFENTSKSSSDILMESLGKAKKIIKSATMI